MAEIEKIFDCENVNGVNLLLKIKSRNSTPNSMSITISFKSRESKSHWHKKSLILAIIFNILSLIYIRISVTAVLIIVIVLSFLIFFWITHSVQSETILVIPTVGIQNSVKYVFGQEDIFVPWSSIDDVIINEVIKLTRVLYYLTLLVKTGTTQANQESEGIKLIPLFKCFNTMPQIYIRKISELAPLTEEQIFRAKALIEHGKSKRAAASAISISESCFRKRLKLNTAASSMDRFKPTFNSEQESIDD